MNQYLLLAIVVLVVVLTTPLQAMIVFRNMVRTSGVMSIARRYRAMREPKAKKLSRQIVRIGGIYYRWTVSARLETGGLYISFGLFGRLMRIPPLFFPWNDITDLLDAKMYGKPAIELVIGRPQSFAITVTEDLYNRMKPYLHVPEKVPAAGMWV